VTGSERLRRSNALKYDVNETLSAVFPNRRKPHWNIPPCGREKSTLAEIIGTGAVIHGDADLRQHEAVTWRVPSRSENT
jgi:hypothetical protein